MSVPVGFLLLVVCLLLANLSEVSAGDKKCTNPKGMDGNSYSEGCIKITCKSGTWRPSIEPRLCCFNGEAYTHGSKITSVSMGSTTAVLHCIDDGHNARISLEIENKCEKYSTEKQVSELKSILENYIKTKETDCHSTSTTMSETETMTTVTSEMPARTDFKGILEILPEMQDGTKWTKDQSIIGTSPGMGVRPENCRMFVVSKGGSHGLEYADRMLSFLKTYASVASQPYKTFDLNILGPCSMYPYGFVSESFASLAPCIFLKLKSVSDWVPEPLDDTDTDWMPRELGDHYNYMKYEGDTDHVWIDCQGRNSADKEAWLETFEYFPRSRGIPIAFFPFIGSSDKIYHSPLVAIKIRPEFIGQLIHVECRAYYKGVLHDTKNQQGLAQFEFIVTE